MATAPLGPVLESALKQDIQGGTLTMQSGRTVYPRFFCCVSGTTVGVDKEPVARKISSVTRVCAGDAVCIDFSKSWSPSSTIVSWSVDWGDGNVSNGVWPGPGVVCHPLGGYLLPGTYKVVLTVTDLLGATGTDTQEIEVIDCDDGPDLELYGSCGSSGVWHSLNAGVSWENVSTEALLDTEIYDLKVHPFTIGADHLELWAATEKGLYKTTNAAGSWTRIILPEAEVGLGEPGVVSIVCSTVDPGEVYVLAHYTIPDNTVWLYRTTDGGLAWIYVQLGGPGGPGAPELVMTNYISGGGHLFTRYNGQLHVCGGNLYSRNPDGTWNNRGNNGETYPQAIAGDVDGKLWMQGNTLTRPLLWNGIAWAFGAAPRFNQDGDVIWPGESGYVNTIYSAFGPDPIGWSNPDGSRRDDGDPTHWYQEPVSYDENCEVYSPWHDPLCYPRILRLYNGMLFVGMGCAIVRFIEWRDCFGVGYRPVWREEQCGGASDFCEHNGILYASGIAKRIGTGGHGTWVDIGVGGSRLFSRGGHLYATSGARLYRIIGSSRVCIGSFQDRCFDLEYDGRWLGACGVDSTPEVQTLGDADGPGGVTVPAEGRTHLTSMSADGLYVYAAFLDDGGNPVVARVAYDFSIDDEGAPVRIWVPGQGTWGGVRCDYNHPERVWIFGDFGAASKVLLSDNWGDTFTDLTEGTWAANEVVRCILPSIYDHNNIIAILSTDQESWHSGDAGTTWVKTGDIPYGVHCGERDWIEDLNVFVGRVNAGAEHIRYSPNNGVHWYEHSGGFEPNAPVTALQIVA